MSERRFDDREVALILRRAAEQEGRAAAGAASGGLTATELEQVAREAGMDPALVRQAAARLDAPGAGSLAERWRGGPRELVVERVLDGEPRGDAAEAMLAAVRAAAGGALGSAEAVGHGFAWRGQLDGAQTDVAVVPANGRTTVRVRIALDGASQSSFAGWFVGAGGGGAFLTFAALVNLLGPVALLPAGAVAGTGYLAARRAFARAQARLAARAEALADAAVRAAATAPNAPRLPG
jgi:hypothetical protein